MPGDTGPEIDLAVVLQGVYDRARYDLRIDYHADPPHIEPSSLEWLDTLLRASGWR